MPMARAVRPSRCTAVRLAAGTNKTRSSVHCRTICAYRTLPGEPSPRTPSRWSRRHGEVAGDEGGVALDVERVPAEVAAVPGVTRRDEPEQARPSGACGPRAPIGGAGGTRTPIRDTRSPRETAAYPKERVERDIHGLRPLHARDRWGQRGSREPCGSGMRGAWARHTPGPPAEQAGAGGAGRRASGGSPAARGPQTPSGSIPGPALSSEPA